MFARKQTIKQPIHPVNTVASQGGEASNMFVRKHCNTETIIQRKSQTRQRATSVAPCGKCEASTFARKDTYAQPKQQSNTKSLMMDAMKKRAPLSFNIDPVAPAPAVAKQTRLPANTKTSKRVEDEAKTGRDGQKFIAAHVSPEAAKQFTLLRVQQDKTTQEMLVEAINDCFAKYGLSRIA